MKINTNDWEWFEFEDIFYIKKGFYNKKPEHISTNQANIPFLGAIDSNNGVTELYNIEDIEIATKTGAGKNVDIKQKIFPKNAVCITNNGSVGYAYFQGDPFTCSHDVNPLYKKDGDFNYYTGLFIATIIMNDRYRWGYGRKWRPKRMVESKLKLPIKRDSNSKPVLDNNKLYSKMGYIPDWEWMESFIKKLHSKPITTSVNTTFKLNLNTEKWKEFYLHELFDVEMGNGIDAVTVTTISPVYSYVSRNSNNNGVVNIVDEIEGQNPFNQGDMTLALGGSYLGSCFIQQKPFYTAQNVAVLKEKTPLSIYSKLFVATLIRNECKIKYQAFGRELNSHIKKDFTVKLPICRNKENEIILDDKHIFSKKGYTPDWEWINNYMKKLKYSDRL